MNEIDKWCAEQCGVTWSDGDTSYGIPQPYWYDKKKGIKHLGEWTTTDPRCREIVREKFKILTFYNNEADIWASHRHGSIDHIGRGKTIAEAEIACIKAINKANG